MMDSIRTAKIKIPSWKYEKTEKAVVDLYVEQGIHSLPIDPFFIIKNRGYVLIPFSKLNNVNSQRGILDDNNDAFSFYSLEHKTYVIVYNDDKPLNRIRFTLMHEVGHIDLGHKGESELARKMADCYAGYALAPSPLIWTHASEKIPDIIAVFWVSPDCANVCSRRYLNWLEYGGMQLKDYEIRLINLFQ